MANSNVYLCEPDFLTKMDPFVEQLIDIIGQDRGVRIGQSTVFSQKMHTCHPREPQEVNVLQDIDAGQVFYHRQEAGSIYHFDIFHQCGLIDHRQVAVLINQNVELYNLHYGSQKILVNDNDDYVKTDCIDIQTGTGGGRITGSLNYGKKLSLRKGHINHVHIAMELPKKHLACVVYIIMAVESLILSSNLELRCNEKIKNISGVGKSKTDLSAYADTSDSLLQDNSSKVMLDTYQDHKDTNDLEDDVPQEKDSQENLVNRDVNKIGSKPNGGVNGRHAPECLVEKGIIEINGKHVISTKGDKQSRNYLEHQLPEIENHLRQVVHEAKTLFKKPGKSRMLQNKIDRHCQQKVLNNSKTGSQCGELAISEMVSAVARRMVEQKETVFRITHADLRYFLSQKRRKVEFCLLIDASSSMQGQRIQVAKFMARYLFSSTSDPISIIVFQQNRAWVLVPFTRDLRQIEQSLEDINAYGETPLALGLTACLQYIEATKVSNPLIILITDGVPTSGTMTNDPVYDALQVAKCIKTKKYGFTCIGLNPYLDYLKQLSEVAGGSIYVVNELGRYVLN